MSIEQAFILVVSAAIGCMAGLVLHKKVPRRLKTDKFADQWQQLQKQLKDRSQWPSALIEADKMLDKALIKRRYKGKSMGERLVSAQRSLSNNDSVWFAHNLAKKIMADEKLRLREADVKDALVGFRQALRDIGALKHDR